MLFLALALVAQTDRAVPSCTTLPPPQTPNGGGGAIAVGGSGFLSVLSPQPNMADVPRNVEIRLSGDTSGLDQDPPTFLFELRAPDSSRIPITRDGASAKPDAPLDANTTYTIHIETTDANPCPQCQPPQDVPFTTNDQIDHDPPVLTDVPPVDVFVMPDPTTAAQCNIFVSETHQVIVDFGPHFPLNTWIDVAGRGPNGEVKLFTEQFNNGQVFNTVGDLGATLPTALGDEFVLAFTATDLAGNVGPPRVLRVRARSFVDENTPHDQLPPLWCELDAAPTLDVPTAMPANGRVQLTFPLEEVPVSLQAKDGTLTPLVPVDEIDGGHVYNTVLPLPQGQSFDVVALACPHCVCPSCDPSVGDVLGSVTANAAVDTTPPHAPVIVKLGEDANPALAVGGACRDDDPALIVTMKPGVDDTSKPLDLRYDAIISVDGGPQLALGRALIPTQKGDVVELRISTRGFGRLLGEKFTLTLDVVDGAGNRAEATATNDPNPAQGCASAGAAFPIALLAALIRRRRRRAA